MSEGEDTTLTTWLTNPVVIGSLIGAAGLALAGATYMMATSSITRSTSDSRSRSRSEPPPPVCSVPLGEQSITFDDASKTSKYCENEQLMTYLYDDAKTVYEIFQRGKKLSSNGDGNCLGWRENGTSPYSWMTYSEVEKRFMAFGSGLTHIGLPTGQKSFIGVYASNCVEWTVTDQSCQAFSRVVVALYDTLGPEAITHIINQAEIECIVCSSSKVDNLIKQVQSCPGLKKLVTIGPPVSDEDRQAATDAGLEIYSFKDIEEKGEANPIDPVVPSPTDISTICYTSGTTGMPKGVVITHGNIVANISGIYKQMLEAITIVPSDVHISYLPLAHMLERVVEALMFMCGSKVGFYRGDVKTLIDDIQVLRPTFFISVPRLLNRVYDRVLSALEASKVKKWLFETAYNSKDAEVQRGVLRRNSMWDWLVFGKIQKLIGGNVRVVFSSSAPLSDKVKRFYQVAFGCYVVEGYGQTETTAGITITLPADTECGSVGPPIPSAKIKLVDVSELNYYAANGEGEVCVSGPSCTSGYYKDEEKTKSLIDDDGWLHTGDIGKWLPNGTLKITDRVKHIFKLSQGEYIAPEKVESICSRSLYIAQIFLYGDSLRSSCIAIVVPDEEVLLGWAKNHGRGEMSFEDLCSDEEVKRVIFDDLQAVGRRDGLNSLEIPKAIKLSSVLFSVENDLLTPTFKVKRPLAKKLFMAEFETMYSTLSM